MVHDNVKCDLCGRSMRLWHDIPCDHRRLAARERFQLYWCQADMFGKIYPRPTMNEIQQFYAFESYYTHEMNAASDDNHEAWSFLQRLRFHLAWRFDYGCEFGTRQLEDLVNRGARSLLDVGCGNGKRLQDAVRAGFEVVIGIEPDPVAREIAISQGLEVYSGTAEAPPAALRDCTFDTVLLMHVLEHSLHPQMALEALKKLLNVSGCMIVEIPNNLAIGCVLVGKCWPWLDVPRHLNYFCFESLNKILSLSQLRTTSAEYCGYTRQFSRDWLETEFSISQIFARIEGRKSPKFFTSELRAWAVLLLSFVARRRRKYDSVRVSVENHAPA